MTVGSFLTAATEQLQTAGISTARLDVLVLMEDTLNTNRAQLLANSDLLISSTQLKTLKKLIARRAQHIPLAYIRNRSEFYGREFFVDQRVLEPRPESETMTDLLKHLAKDLRKTTVIDIGTGSGALGITAKLELPNSTVYCLDIDKNCLAVARKNAEQLSAKVTFKVSDLLQEIPDFVLAGAVLLCNLPYVPDNFQINTAATHEPRLAIFGGGDGLNVYRNLFKQIDERKAKPAYILTEALPPQHELLTSIANTSGFVLEQSEDFIQVFRIATADLEL